ncbi:hypothetical protein ACTFIZ_004147 [Dictyostelium cf. discoideum]
MTSFEQFFHYAYGVIHCTYDIHTSPNGVLIHRDLKSSNFMVDENNLIKLGDFGCARIFSTQNQETLKKIAGTPSFQPPEAFHNKVANSKTDIFALGVVLFEICAPIPYIGVKYIFPFGDLTGPGQINLGVNRFLRPILHDSIPLQLSNLIYSMLNHNDYDRPSAYDCFKTLEKIEKIYREDKVKWDSIFNKINIDDDVSEHVSRQHKIGKIIETKFRESNDSKLEDHQNYNRKLIINYSQGCIRMDD